MTLIKDGKREKRWEQFGVLNKQKQTMKKVAIVRKLPNYWKILGKQRKIFNGAKSS